MNIQIIKENECIRIGCNKEGNKLLLIRYIRKKGWFCDECSQQLVKEELIEGMEK